jgi:catechol 2,3-dioxygenase-like lactoylglutathione lyase family enzyme
VPVGSGGVIHVNVNCVDLEGSLAFYRDRMGLNVAARTTPESPQDGTAFGLDLAQWDACLMSGPAGFGRPVIDLLQWIVPAPIPRGDEDRAGFRSLILGGPQPSVDRSEDPDGTPVERRPGEPGLQGVVVGCSNLERSRRFYEETVAVGSFVELTSGTGRAPTAANTVGIWRLALATEDIDADVDELRAAGVECRSDPVEMSMGPGLPSLRFVLFSDPDGTTLELIERRPA